MANGINGWHNSSEGTVGKVIALKKCETCDLYEFHSGSDFPHLCRSGGRPAAMVLADGQSVSDCDEYDEASQDSGSSGKGKGIAGKLAAKAGDELKKAAMKDVKTGMRNLGRMI
jgi:hypothetical protein